MNSANMSANVESIVANLIAWRRPTGVCSNFRVCTIDECR